MPTMVTFRAGTIVLMAAAVLLSAGCSREQQDWRSAESADTSEAWARFIEQHPESELISQARARIAQLAEAQDWHTARVAGTAEAYRAFLARHPTGKLAEEARIHIESFSFGSAPRIAPASPEELASASAGVPALQVATGEAAAPQPAATATPDAAATSAATPSPPGFAQPGEPAQAGTAAAPAAVAAAPIAVAAATPPVGTPEGSDSPTDGYGVQLGAFGNPASADREWQRLQERFGSQLGGLSPRIVVASSGTGQLYRLQASAGGEAQARAICDSLKEQSQACVPVIPR
jgi:sporulation related protein